MIDRINAMLRRQPDSSADIDYLDSISDLINHPSVRSMKNYIQHCDVDCLNTAFMCRTAVIWFANG